MRVAAIRLTGVDYPWYLQCGLANQYVLGPGLQPSVFGILLITSLAAFANGRPMLAAGLAAASAVMHSTYLLPAGLLMLGYMLVLTRQGQKLRALAAGLFALVIVMPVLSYNLRSFSLGDADEFQAAQQILAEVRIPHHAVIERWLDAVAVIQIALMLLALWLVRRSAILYGSGTRRGGEHDADRGAGTDREPHAGPALPVAILGDSDADRHGRDPVEAGKGCDARLEGRETAGRVVVWASIVVAIALAVGGVLVSALSLGYRVNEAELPLLEYVREHKKSGEVYLLPVKFPTLKKEVAGRAVEDVRPAGPDRRGRHPGGPAAVPAAHGCADLRRLQGRAVRTRRGPRVGHRR